MIMSYRQHAPSEVPAPAVKVIKVECEKSGTIYYEHVDTKQRAWTKSALEPKK